MARLAGIDLPDNQRIDYSLTLLYGIGWSLSRIVLEKAGVPPHIRTRDLTEEQLAGLSHAIESFTTEGDLRRKIRQDVQRLRDTGTYRGIRHNRGLPSRGQRTRSNARTKRGKRKTVGAFKKEVLSKQSQQDARSK